MKCGCSLRASAFSISSRMRSTSVVLITSRAQRPLGEHLVQVARPPPSSTFSMSRCAHLGLVAVADRLDQQVAQRRVLEDALVAEHVEDLVAERLALLRELLEQPLEHLALAGLVRDQVPEVADLGLADAVDAPEALLDAVRVPGQVVVHQRWARCRLMPSPAASVATSTRASGSCVKYSCASRRFSRPTPPWIATTASGRPSSVRIFSTR